ncbi:hypothetical protein LTR37_016615 [Vermiconidia calcicola]|uniref:Uncharacterized protein n=1 Tax=Vermiconidia calcicola TaxID=1690605 RepID=A0ACC3MN43_9PEZI|nr:hypothetical protein LTR37_016615 [Vermiconidia calcicola]
MAAATTASAEARRSRPPPLQTSFSRPSTAPHTDTPTSSGGQNNGYGSPTQTQQNGTSAKTQIESSPGHQRFVLTDPLAFRYLEEDPATKVLARRKELEGYECYVVEQWSTSRSHPTFTITTYTGDPSHTVVVGVLSVPGDESSWSPQLRVYFKALNQYHARRRETPLGILMVTNLSGFPSSLTVIHVPDGDLRKHRSDFFVNEDLKRLNCAGRVGLTLSPPTAATVAKFHQLYRTSDKNDIYQSVIELVKLCQSALMLFDKLDIDYADGLLCDVTERGVNDWWLEIGSPYYNIEPHDGILGPTTVAGLLGLLMGARNRLHAVGAPVAKDAFDVEAMKRGVSVFQKQQKIQRTRRLDRKTLDRLLRATAKAASSEGWTVPKAVKSTVAELSGKGGEMVMDVVGRRDKAGIAEIETCDMERFVQLVYGERGKWLWYGKALKKSTTREIAGVPLGVKENKDSTNGKQLSFRQNEHGGYTWTARKSVADGLGSIKREQSDTLPVEQEEGDEDGVVGVIKRTSGFKEAKSGLGRFKGAVGLGGHQHRETGSKDGSPLTPRSPLSPRLPQSPVEDGSPTNSKEHRKRPSVRRAHSSPVSSIGSPKSPVQEQRQKSVEEAIPEQPDIPVAPAYAASYREAVQSKESVRPPSYVSQDPRDGDDDGGNASDQGSQNMTIDAASVAESIYNDVNLNEVLPTGPETERDLNRLMKRTVSYSRVIDVNLQTRSDDAYPRHLSFSLAEESVLTWEAIVSSERDPYYDDPRVELTDEEFKAKESKHLQHLITELSSNTVAFTQAQLQSLASVLSKLDEDHETLESLYHPHTDRVHSLQTNSEGILRAERERLEEGGKEIETLAAKLDYEINGLKGKVEDVEAGVEDFQKGVGRVEERVKELEKDAERAEQRRWGCVVS